MKLLQVARKLLTYCFD